MNIHQINGYKVYRVRKNGPFRIEDGAGNYTLSATLTQARNRIAQWAADDTGDPGLQGWYRDTPNGGVELLG